MRLKRGLVGRHVKGGVAQLGGDVEGVVVPRPVTADTHPVTADTQQGAAPCRTPILVPHLAAGPEHLVADRDAHLRIVRPLVEGALSSPDGGARGEELGA